MAEEEAAHHLLNVLEERELNVDLDKVLAIFEDGETKRDAAAWVNEYLNPETLLTKEELELYQTLRKKGVLHQYEDDDEPVRPILDHELSFAIDSLQSSTAAIEEQCKVLEAQRHALMALKALDKPNLSVEHMRNERRRKENQEKARLDTAVEDISISINEQLTDTQRDIEAEKSTLNSYLTERLASDDQILSKVPGIVSQIVSKPEINEDENSIDQWCRAIISFRTAEIKAKVDVAYLNRLANSSTEDLPTASEEELKERKADLQAELETLHSEITPVAEMVVEHELRKPMTDIKERKDRERTQARSAWLNYVLSTLEYMAKRLDTVTYHTQSLDGFQQALAHVNAAALQRMPDSNAEVLTPSIKRATSGPKSGLFAGVKLKPMKALDLPSVLQDALRNAGISFNQDCVEALQDSLARAQLEREKKLEEHYISASSSTHERLAERFGKADGDLRAVLDALYSHTPFSAIHLSSSELDEQLRGLERELEDSDDRLLSAETSQLSLSDPKVRAFISKFGR